MAHWPRSLSAGTAGLQPIAPGDAGFAPDLEARLDKAVANKRIWNQHGLIVLRNDRLVLERYFEGEDQARGVGEIGHVTFKPDTMHDLRSCSKSIVGLLYGVALQQGKVPPPEAPLFSAFPEYADLADKDGRDRLTIQHVLTMTMGTDWDESSLFYTDPRNSETAMDNAADRYRYVLERRVVDTPGAHWSYCGGATALLARMIAKGSGKTLHEFARENLFDPLGMGPTEWAAGPDGEPFAASGARMSVRDLARIGVLMLHGGKVDERVVVPADWVTRCITPVISADEVRRYGYQWFVWTSRSASQRAGRPDGWSACGGHRAKAVSGCLSSRHCNSSSPSLPEITEKRTREYRQRASCVMWSWKAFARDAGYWERRGMTPSRYRDLALRKCPPSHGPCPKKAT
jgi:CubicO group peptidase (beta-lactamase class C family)